MLTKPAFIVAVCMFLLTNRAPVFAQAQPTPTPDPVIATLQAQVDAQATAISTLTFQQQELSLEVREAALNARDQYFPIGAIGVIFGLLGLLGIGVSVLDARRRIRDFIDKAVYGVDPMNMTVHIPADDFEKEKSYLQRRGFYQFQTYNNLDTTCLRHCVIVKVTNEQELNIFSQFLEHNKPDADMVAYLLYTGEYQIPRDKRPVFDNYTMSNTRSTLASNLFTLAAMMIRPRRKRFFRRFLY